MGKDVFEATIHRRVLSKLRELRGIPQISLFYL
jgi:hypothetical protein